MDEQRSRDRRTASGGPLCSSGAHKFGPIGEQMTCPDKAIRFVGRRGERSHHFGIDSVEIAEDGQTLLEKLSFENERTDLIYKRQ